MMTPTMATLAALTVFAATVLWLRGNDLLGLQRTWRGDWRKEVDNSTSTPADFLEPKYLPQ